MQVEQEDIDPDHVHRLQFALRCGTYSRKHKPPSSSPSLHLLFIRDDYLFHICLQKFTNTFCPLTEL